MVDEPMSLFDAPTQPVEDVPLPTRAEQAREGARLRDEGMARVESHADPDWKAAAAATVEQVARTHREFTSDDVWEAGLPKVAESRALGPVMSAAARAGLIVSTDRFVSTTQPKSHRSPARVWASRIYEERPDDGAL